MKVQDIASGRLISGSEATNNSGEVKGHTFQKLLDSHLQKIDKQFSVSDSMPAPDISQPSAALRLEGLSITDRTLDTLEKFGTALQNDSFKSMELEPYVDALEENTASLVALKNQLATQDPLASLIDRVAITSYVEAVKFRRGDYNS